MPNVRSDRRALLKVSLAAGALAAVPAIARPHNAGAQSASDLPTAFSDATGHTVSGVFLDWWLENNRIAKIGQPVTEPQTEDGRTIQYFMYGALETDDLASGDVTQIDVGNEYLADHPATPPDEGIIQDPLDRIADTWRFNGGDTRFGAPILDPVITDDQVVQWYEFGAVAIATGGVEGTAHVVPVGEDLAKSRDVSTKKVERGDLDLLAPVFVGDDQFTLADQGFNPVELYLPDLGTDAAIETIGVTDGVMGTPAEPLNVGWYGDYARPGDQNTVVMAGHVDWYTIGAAVFYTLRDATPGMMFYVLAGDGAAATYECVDAYALGESASGDNILRGTGVDSLALITCTGNFADGHYDQRQIVYAERI